MRTSVPAVVGTKPVGIRFELVDLESLRDEWMRLAEQGKNIFATWEFARTWWQHFGTNRRLLTVGCRDLGGELFAILPLYLWRRRPLRVMRFVGAGVGDILGPVCPPERNEDAARALSHLLKVAPWDWDVLLAENLPGEEHWPARLGGRLIRWEANPVLRGADSYDQFLARRTSNFRRQARAWERRLNSRYRVRFRLSDPARLDSDLDILFRLHEAYFGDSSSFVGRGAFHRDFARKALERGWLRLWMLELDDDVVAAHYGFRFGGAEFFYQAGRNPAFQRESLGTTLILHIIRSAFDDGIREFAFLRGQEPYKYRFATDDSGLESVCVVRGRAATTAVALIQTIRSSPIHASAIARRVIRRALEI
jgi:CelD/BcsL family acetyltransferase involved in cellulose biosynthesis